MKSSTGKDPASILHDKDAFLLSVKSAKKIVIAIRRNGRDNAEIDNVVMQLKKELTDALKYKIKVSYVVYETQDEEDALVKKAVKSLDKAFSVTAIK